jgi:DNA-binding MarR family transcriptional regulator
MHQIEIKQRLLIAQHNVSRVIDRLETEGLVRRESYSADGRAESFESSPPADRS